MKTALQVANIFASALLIGSMSFPARGSTDARTVPNSQSHAAPLPEGSIVVARGGGGGGHGGFGGGRGGGFDRGGGDRGLRSSADMSLGGGRDEGVDRGGDVARNANANRAASNAVGQYGGYAGGYGGGGAYYAGWDDGAAAAAVVAGAVASAAVVGSIADTAPSGCSLVAVNGTGYLQCANGWYQPEYAGSSVQYVVVNAPH